MLFFPNDLTKHHLDLDSQAGAKVGNAVFLEVISSDKLLLKYYTIKWLYRVQPFEYTVSTLKSKGTFTS